MLNDAADVVNSTFAFDHPAAPGFLFATLLAQSTSGTSIPGGKTQNDANGTGASTSSTSSTSQNTGVAM